MITAARDLSARQSEVLSLLVDGHTNQEVATKLGLSVKTVETHRARLYERLECDSRAGLVRAARALTSPPVVR